jgi:hypothetical protein
MTPLPLLLCVLAASGERWTVTEAVRMVESGGVDRKVGDHGLSRGPFQAHRVAWDEACTWGGVQWSYDRLAWSRWHSAQVFRWYGQMHGAKTAEQFARCWNGGPAGPWKASTRGYWKRVAKALKQRRTR